MLYLAILLLTLASAIAWMYLYFGPRRLPADPFVELWLPIDDSHSPTHRLARLALRHAEVVNNMMPGESTINDGIAFLKGHALADFADDPAWARVSELALAATRTPPPPRVAVCMAARDEAENLPATLAGLSSVAYWPLRIVVCDDGSTDATPKLLHDASFRRGVLGLTAIRSMDLPRGWAGKNWALHQAVKKACNQADVLPVVRPPIQEPDEDDVRPALLDSGEVRATVLMAPAPHQLGRLWYQVLPESPTDSALLPPGPFVPPAPPPDWLAFVDADVVLQPDALHTAIRMAELRELDALSIVPQMSNRSLGEKLLVPFLWHMLSLLFPARVDVPRPDGQYLGCGMWFVIRRNVYEAIGGHQRVHSRRVEDMALASLLHREGFKISWGFTRTLATARMYRGFGAAWSGLSKNAYEGMGARLEKLIVGVFVAVVLGVMPAAVAISFEALDPYTVVVSSSAALALQVTLFSAALLGMLFSFASYARVLKLCNQSVFWAWTLPLSTVLYVLICIHSALRQWVFGGPVWKGRRYTRMETTPPPATAASRSPGNEPVGSRA